MQPNLPEAERRIEEARKTQAASLDLGDLALRELPASLGDLPHLKTLSLGWAKLTEAGTLERDAAREASKLRDLAPIAGLQALQRLYLLGTGVTDLAPIAGLKALQNLNLSDTGVADLTPIAGLQELQNLNLYGCRGVTDLAPIAGLHALQNLNLLNTGVTELAPIAGLQALQNLNLSDTGVADLTPIAGLQELQSLRLWGTGVTDLAPIAGLQALQTLNLSSTDVTDLAPIAGLQALQTLNLWGTGVTDLAPIARLQALQNLNLSSTDVTDLAPIAGLQGLQILNLRFCRGVTDLAPITGLRALQILDLFGYRPAVPATILQVCADHPRLATFFADEAVGVPREVLSHGSRDNCLPRLRTYFSELTLGAEAENEVKVIILGNGRVGKTQLCRRFRDQRFEPSIESTHGVQIWREKLRIRTGDKEQVFQVNWWDFGGQDIYHGTHALFLRSRAVFLILWTPSLENRNEETENGITLRNQPLAYWLDYVRTLAGKGSPVIVVQSQCDRFADRRPSPAKPDGIEFFESCSYSAKEDLGRETLEAQLRDAIRYLIERNGAVTIGKGRAKVRRRLYEWRSEDQQRAPAERRHRAFTREEFQALCSEAGGILSWEHTLDYFHQTGVVFHNPNLFSDCIVLDQDWALDAVYTVFHRGKTIPLLRDSGRFTREDLAQMIWQEHSVEEQRLFLGLMKSCGVCFPCGRTLQGEERYIAPDLLPKFEAVAGRLYAWNKASDIPTLRLEYRFFHPAIIRDLMSRIGQDAGDLAEYWKYGLWFKDGQRDTQLLVQFEDTSTDEAPGAGALELKAQGRDPLGLLREIRQAILWRQRRLGEEPEEWLTLEGTTVARSALTTMMDGRVLDRQNKPVLAAAFAAFFADREHDAEETKMSEENKIDVIPAPLTETEKPREVFISYAWGDDTPEGQIRAQVVDALTAALEKDGFAPVRDRDQIQSGERISAFIRRLTRADLVVAVISDKYLRSPYCMYEIYKLWQKSQTDADDMLKRLVPIVLPEVKIGNFRERVPYLEHWSNEAQELEALIRRANLSPGSRSWEEVRLVREVAQHIDDILNFLQDVLMPRKLDAHLDNGFEAVREALWRRLS
jgi:internalin A